MSTVALPLAVQSAEPSLEKHTLFPPVDCREPQKTLLWESLEICNMRNSVQNLPVVLLTIKVSP